MTTITKSAPAPVQTSIETPEQELVRLKAENASLKAAGVAAKTSRKFGLKVAEKSGAVQMQVPGQRFPICPHAGDAVAILENAVEICQFIRANEGKLSFARKEDPSALHDAVRKDVLARIAVLLGS